MNDCACQIDGNAGGGRCDFGDPIIREARKEHKCCECARVIPKGEKYEVFEGSWDGEFSTYKTCIDCVSARAFFCSWVYEFMWQDMREMIDETCGQINYDCLNACTPAARAKIIEMIDKCWEGLDE